MADTLSVAEYRARLKKPRKCSIEGCGHQHFARGWCLKHYGHWRTSGDPLNIKVQHYSKRLPANISVREVIELRSVPVPEAGCWLWEAADDGKGYGQFRLRGIYYKAHVASYEAFIAPVPDDLCVCHKCDVPACVNPSHLFLATHAENMKDRDRKGRNPHGEDSFHAKLNREAVLDIRTARMVQAQFAALYGVSVATVFDIQARRTWKRLP